MAKDKLRDRFLGVGTAIATYLIYSWIGSFETKADAQDKYHLLDVKITKILCVVKPDECLENR